MVLVCHVIAQDHLTKELIVIVFDLARPVGAPHYKSPLGQV